jgi:hypothetical protein
MSLSIAILLIISTNAENSETFSIPPVPPGLPKAKTAPVDGFWIDSDGNKEESENPCSMFCCDGCDCSVWKKYVDCDRYKEEHGVFLPLELSQDVLMRLELLERTPEMCKERLVWAKKRCDIDINAAVDVALADAGLERIETDTKQSGWPTWQVAIIAVGASVVGASIGAAAIAIYR